MGIFLIEHFEDFFCVVVALGKNNRFSDFAAVVDFQGVLHNDIQDLPDGVLVEQPTVQSRCINAGRQVAVFILKGVFVGFPFFVRKFIVGQGGSDLVREQQPFFINLTSLSTERKSTRKPSLTACASS